MAEPHVISALTAKRSELAGIITHHRKEITRLSAEVNVLDATIKLFDPDYRINAIKPKRYHRRNDFFKHSEAHKLLLDIIRTARKPISTIEIAEEAQHRKGLELDSDKLSAFKATICTALSRQRRLGLITEVTKDRGTSVWVIA
jgi:hypothetical protein